MLSDFCKIHGVDMQKEVSVLFDVGNPEFLKGHFEYVHHPLERQGVDFW